MSIMTELALTSLQSKVLTGTDGHLETLGALPSNTTPGPLVSGADQGGDKF